ncbi:MAG: hypothetical protein JW869_01520 [Candidatus Omnitrophica bacterium]|nr:hypothetical protein [Candidatus Omnitrophota bacterium]
MTKSLIFFLAGLTCMFSLVPTTCAQDQGEMMVTIYGGLADIIESNMNDPNMCITQVKQFGQRHKAEIEKLSAILQGAQESDAQAEFDTESQSQGLQAMMDCTMAMQNFSIQNRDHARELAETMETICPEIE